MTPMREAHSEEEALDSASEETGLISTSLESTSILDDIRFLRRIRVFAEHTKPSEGELGTLNEDTDNPEVASQAPLMERTLYFGNLSRFTPPPGQSPNLLEDALRQLFQPRQGFRKLVFRQKRKGPEFFAEFTNVSHAEHALYDLEGSTLNGLIPGKGISLSVVEDMLKIRRLNPPPQPRELISEGDDIV